MSKHKVLIVGGGFGGIKTALELADDHRFQVTLVSELTSFRYYPALYRTATGGKRHLSDIPLSEVFAHKNVRLINDRVVALDRQKRTVLTKVNHRISYDALVLGLGVKTNYFHIEGLEEYSYGIKSIEEAEQLKNHIHEQLMKQKAPDLNYVVVGGGPTGVELAGALPSYIHKVMEQHGLKRRKVHIDLVEAAPRLLPRAPKIVSRKVAKQLRKLGVKLYLKTAVQAQTADALMINNKPIRSHTVIWTAGVTNHPFFSEQGFQLSKSGKVRVDQFLQAEPGVYVIGDNADTPYSGMAQTALHDGKYVAQNLRRLANKVEPKPYQAKKPVYVFPAGPQYAAVVWGPIQMYGKVGWLLRKLADLVAFHDYLPWKMASTQWISEEETEESCILCVDV